MKKQHGGARSNSGQKPKYGEKTTTIAFRVPVSKVTFFTNLMRKHLQKLEVKKK